MPTAGLLQPRGLHLGPATLANGSSEGNGAWNNGARTQRARQSVLYDKDAPPEIKSLPSPTSCHHARGSKGGICAAEAEDTLIALENPRHKGLWVNQRMIMRLETGLGRVRRSGVKSHFKCQKKSGTSIPKRKNLSSQATILPNSDTLGCSGKAAGGIFAFLNGKGEEYNPRYGTPAQAKIGRPISARAQVFRGYRPPPSWAPFLPKPPLRTRKYSAQLGWRLRESQHPWRLVSRRDFHASEAGRRRPSQNCAAEAESVMQLVRRFRGSQDAMRLVSPRVIKVGQRDL
ncbi:hypothetical protein C8R44DRAFT_739440 [Mycena epipterygia]|nr:hypothetical protein C8R44DRAFT_739440 [Mycena epipterygia]